MRVSFQEFSEWTIVIKGGPFSLAGRPYLDAVYSSPARRIILRAGRQVEKSTFLVNRILYEAYQRPGIRILYVAPRLDQARQFSCDRLAVTVRESPIIQRLLYPSSAPLPTLSNRPS
jgi:phage terminase large subunit GpA-like protein